MVHLSRTNKSKLDRDRHQYQLSDIRPLRIEWNNYNYLLLRDQLDVTWIELPNDLRNAVIDGGVLIVKSLLRARVNGLTLTNIPLTTSHQLINLLTESGIVVKFKELDTLSSHNFNYSILRDVINIRENMINHRLPISIHIGENYLLQQFLKLTNTHYRLIGLRTNIFNVQLDELLDLEDEFKDDVFINCVRNNYHSYLDVLLSTDYTPILSRLVDDTNDLRTVAMILESHLHDDYKISYLNQWLTKGRMYKLDCRLYHDPICLKYLRMIDDCTLLPEAVKEYLIDGRLPKYPDSTTLTFAIKNYNLEYINGHPNGDIDLPTLTNMNAGDYVIILSNLNQDVKDGVYQSIMNNNMMISRCADSRLREYWSRVPIKNERFLKYIQWKGEPLPPPIEGMCSTIHLTNNIDNSIIKELVNDRHNYQSMLDLIQLMHRGVINIRSYDGPINAAIKLLTPYQPVRSIKGIR